MIIDGIEASGDAAAGIPITMLAYGDSWFDYPVHDLLRAFNDAMDDAPAILTRARAGNELVKDITGKRALNEIKLDLKSYGAAEALWLDESSAWVGLDNDGQARGDGESRPLLWQFAAPKDGWSAP